MEKKHLDKVYASLKKIEIKDMKQESIKREDKERKK